MATILAIRPCINVSNAILEIDTNEGCTPGAFPGIVALNICGMELGELSRTVGFGLNLEQVDLMIEALTQARKTLEE